jgi:hypothetical protein
LKAQEDKLWSLGREERKQGWQAFIGTIGGKRSREVEGGNNEKEKVKDEDDCGDGQGEIERQAKRSTSS